MDFADFFLRATTYPHYPYQERLAQAQNLPSLLVAPTGSGKTEAAVLSAWLWRRQHHPEEAVRATTPRRLVYCLPMRTLVEQTCARVRTWLDNLGLSDRVSLTVLMGGEQEDHWSLYPEKERILLGTQDMIISRALNRGYASSPFHWPVEFGLLNNDCLWVLDEVQLMANGLPTSTQLQAFRYALGTYGFCHTLWMSATVHTKWLKTVDFDAISDDQIFGLDPADFCNPQLAQRCHASKSLDQLDILAKGDKYDPRTTAHKVSELHQAGTMTLMVANTVPRAQAIYQELEKIKPPAKLVLVHSRFRPPDRQSKNGLVTTPVEANSPGRIVVATQAVEAGVDISARTLVTDLAPWPSLVQRFGRCNRRGEYPNANVYWLDVPKEESAPYDVGEMEEARRRLQELEGRSVAPASLPNYEDSMPHRIVLRKRDLVGLYDTTADLSGSYLDVSRFVRGTDETDVQVFWREWEGEHPGEDISGPSRDELCSVPIGEIKQFLDANSKGNRRAKGGEHESVEGIEAPEDAGEPPPITARMQRRLAWHWNHLFGRWEPVSAHQVYPGQTLMLPTSGGGYAEDRGWYPSSNEPVPGLILKDSPPGEGYDSEPNSVSQLLWVSLRDHTSHVCQAAERLLDGVDELRMSQEVRDAVLIAARYHDLGKSHDAFQRFLLSNLEGKELPEPEGAKWAKRGTKKRPSLEVRPPFFRHEVASALALLYADISLNGWGKDLAAYLAAAHHGKVRLSMRSLPKARDQSPDHYYLLGFRLFDENVEEEEWRQANLLPPADLGGGIETAQAVVNTSIAQIGVNDDGERSWLDRTLSLLAQFGPFRLAYLEALLRAADVCASINEQEGGGDNNG